MRKRYSIDLNAHMAECDANYARLLALAPALCRPVAAQSGRATRATPGAASQGADVAAVEQAEGDCAAAASEFALDMPGHNVEVQVQLVERSRYTTLVRFTQMGPVIPEVAGVKLNLAPPTMLIRLYHDAQSAEVVEVRNETRFKEVYEYPNPLMRSRDEKAQVNRFFGEYLAMCLRHGLAVERVAVGED